MSLNENLMRCPPHGLVRCSNLPAGHSQAICQPSFSSNVGTKWNQSSTLSGRSAMPIASVTMALDAPNRFLRLRLEPQAFEAQAVPNGDLSGTTSYFGPVTYSRHFKETVAQHDRTRNPVDRRICRIIRLQRPAGKDFFYVRRLPEPPNPISDRVVEALATATVLSGPYFASKSGMRFLTKISAEGPSPTPSVAFSRAWAVATLMQTRHRKQCQKTSDPSTAVCHSAGGLSFYDSMAYLKLP